MHLLEIFCTKQMSYCLKFPSDCLLLARCREKDKENSSGGWKLHRLCCQQDVLPLYTSWSLARWAWHRSLSNWQGNYQIWNANGPFQVFNTWGIIYVSVILILLFLKVIWFHALNWLYMYIFIHADWLTWLVLALQLQLACNLLRIFLRELINQCLSHFCRRIREQVLVSC